jgi:hypothetical protein
MAVTDNGDGSVTLTPVKANVPKRSILDGLKPLTKAECLQAWGPETDGDENDRIAAAMAKLPVPLPEE